VSEEPHSGSGGGGGRRGAKPKVVSLPQKRVVEESELTNLRASGLTDETIALAEVYTEHHRTVIAQILQRRAWSQGAALVIPFYLPGGAEPHAYRVRPRYPRTEKRANGKSRAVKYDQAVAHGTLVYFAPRARAGRWYADPARPLYWTEGEKKALVFDQLELACVGLTGVWNWGDRQHRTDTGAERLHPTLLEHVTVAGRHHVICFDADAKDNENVMLAAARLCGVLRAGGAISVRFVCPPALEQKGIDDFFAANGGDAMLQLLASATNLEPADPKQPLQPIRKLKAMRDAPIEPNLLMPDGYSIDRDGSLWRSAQDEKHSDVRVAPSPMFIVRELIDHQTGDRRADVLFRVAEDQWQTLCVSRKATADTRAMVAELSAYGAPVTSNSAAKVIDWLEAYATVNSTRIPRIASVSSAGWHTVDGTRVFVLNEAIGVDENLPSVALDTRGDRRKMFDALKPRGDLEQHTAALRRAWETDPTCAAMIAGALAAPLLEPLGASNFAIHLPGESSRGKTSMLKIAASVFGDPNNSQWVASWNVTHAGAEMRAVTLCDLPQCYDEVGGGDAQAAERMVYSLINGGGRTRAQRDLTIRETQSWRTVVLSTGERELADESTATGAQVRVIHLPVRGFGELTAAEVDALRDECAANAGQFGRAWVESLLTVSEWEPYRATLRDFVKMMRAKHHDPLQGRVAAYFALLAVVESIASQCGLGDSGGATMYALFANLARREEVCGVAERARDLVHDWVLSEPDAFPELGMSTAGENDEPPRSRNGKTRYGFRKQGTILIIPVQFREFCKRHRLSPQTVIREWLALGWTEIEPGRITSGKKVRLGAYSTPRFVFLLPTSSTDSGVE
jgi:hypothetical protein